MKLKKVLLLVCLFIAVSCSGAGSLEVEKVIDGDSFRLKGGREVRLLGIDAPEYGKPGADISRDFLEKALSCGEISLKISGNDVDKYGRLLRHVYVNDVFINREIIKKGYAVARYISPGEKHGKDFLELQQEAESSRRGLWAFGVFNSEELLEKGIVSWRDVHNYYGKEVTVEGTVVKAYNSGKACFLNFHLDWKNHFTAVIFAGDFNKFSKSPETLYLNKKVRIKGLVKKYKGMPEIVVKSPKQVQIIN